MAKILCQASYTVEGTKGLLKEGGSGRKAAVVNLLEGVGGRLEAFYYAFGDADVYLIADVPDHVTAAAISLAVNAAGAASCRTTVLLTAEEVDAAAKKTIKYRPPGK